MKLVKQTSTEIIFRQLPDLFTTIFMVLWASGFIGLPLFMVYQTLTKSGNVVFSCLRVEPKLVNCQSKMTPLLNIAPAIVQNYDAVIDVKYKADEITGDEGAHKNDYYVVLITKRGEIPAFQGSIYVNGVRGNPEQAQDISTRLSQFLQSQQKSIAFTASGWQNSLIFSFVISSVFILVGILSLSSTVKVVTLRLDKNRNRLSWSSLSILGFWSKSQDIREIQSVEVKENDADDDPYFTTAIVMQSGKKYGFGSRSDRSTAIANANQIRNFLDLQVSNHAHSPIF